METPARSEHLLYEYSPDIVFLLNSDAIVETSPSITRLSGFNQAGVVGQELCDIVPEAQEDQSGNMGTSSSATNRAAFFHPGESSETSRHRFVITIRSSALQVSTSISPDTRELSAIVKTNLKLMLNMINLHTRSDEEPDNRVLELVRSGIVAIYLVNEQPYSPGVFGTLDAGEYLSRLAKSFPHGQMSEKQVETIASRDPIVGRIDGGVRLVVQDDGKKQRCTPRERRVRSDAHQESRGAARRNRRYRSIGRLQSYRRDPPLPPG